MKFRNTILIAGLLLASFSPLYSQTSTKFFLGKQYLVSKNSYNQFKYRREFTKLDNDIYRTNYIIANPKTGKDAIGVEVIHNKNKRKIKVLVTDLNQKLFSIINDEELTYDKYTNTAFGFKGSISGLIGSNVPNQLKVQFLSENYDYISLNSVLGLHEHSEYEFLILDKEYIFMINQNKETKETKEINKNALYKGSNSIERPHEVRSIVVNPPFNSDRNIEGKVVISILITPDGNVIEAKAGARGTTIADPKLWEELENQCFKTVFSKTNSPSNQSTYIKFNFKKN